MMPAFWTFGSGGDCGRSRGFPGEGFWAASRYHLKMAERGDGRWLAAERRAAKLTLPELALALGVKESLVASIEAGEAPLPAWLRLRVAAVSAARVEDMVNARETEAQRRLSAHPDRVVALALVDPTTLAAAIAEAERRQQAGEDVGYEAILGEWAARPR